ncbi:GDSL-type esterase/lipase family protein [Microbacterium sp. No. 7]|uniref:GDSL-type esterase/lipase family protein n=1 Tax=Microbacterium sp. No. 7 TaxID=1714373 RepID=UPI0006D165D6|nr:GDSL-type esterase/lipase family protein [Microbacterium sp. No. 7]ALJ18857.1 hypothetical protein AOA12_02590 [Microbacterium sp. No. 7]
MAQGLLRGLLAGLPLAAGSRLPQAQAAKLPVDTVGAARVPAGLHLAFRGDAAAVRLRIAQGAPADVPSPGQSGGAAVWAGEAFVSDVALDRDGAAVIELPPRPADTVVRAYLPEGREIVGATVEALDGEIAPPPPVPSIVAYGDSITQGWTVPRPGLGWPSVMGRRHGWDVVNLGFAGSARGETQAAIAVADAPGDAVVVAWGTNAWGSAPTDARLIAETARLFLRTIRDAAPQLPIVCLSPVVRPDAEAAPNRYGATLADLRAAIERGVRDLADATGDTRIVLVPGAAVIDPDDLVDGVHPGPAGHERIAAAVGDVLAGLLPSSR